MTTKEHSDNDSNVSAAASAENDAATMSRRNFLGSSTIGLGAAAAMLSTQALAEGKGPRIPSIRIGDAIRKSLEEEPAAPTFEGRGMSGAEVFANLCKQEGLAALFCCPGNYTIINALAAVGIPSYGGRTEGSMCAMADGFSRSTGEVTATSGTEGPGFTHMIMNIAAANSARTPLLVLASNMTLAGEDREAFIQHSYQQPTTQGLKKYGKRIIDPARIHEYGAYAFRNLKSGVPQPVHLDFPAEVTRARFKAPTELRDFYDKSKYAGPGRERRLRAHPEGIPRGARAGLQARARSQGVDADQLPGHQGIHGWPRVRAGRVAAHRTGRRSVCTLMAAEVRRQNRPSPR